jgi:hypothetical protein
MPYWSETTRLLAKISIHCTEKYFIRLRYFPPMYPKVRQSGLVDVELLINLIPSQMLAISFFRCSRSVQLIASPFLRSNATPGSRGGMTMRSQAQSLIAFSARWAYAGSGIASSRIALDVRVTSVTDQRRIAILLESDVVVVLIAM